MAAGWTIAKVYVDKAVYHIDKPFDYLVPEPLQAELRRGCRVVVPFGGGDRRRLGMVAAVEEAAEPRPGLKAVLLLVDRQPVFTEEMFRMARFLTDRTFCTFFDAVKTILPGGLNMNLSQRYELARMPEEEALAALTPEERNLISFLHKARSGRELDDFLLAQEGSGKQRVVESLLEKGLLRVSDVARQKVADKSISLLRLSDSWLSGELDGKLTPKQREIVDFLEQNIAAEKKEVLYFCAAGEGVVRTLLKKGICTLEQKAVERPQQQADAQPGALEALKLSPAQQEVFDGLSALLREEKAQAALLYGVTGSGKTQIYSKLIEQVVCAGKQALMLVPEISLTPQLVARFRALFGARVAVLHSNLSLRERLDAFRRIRDGKAQIVVGTRSAVFAPCSRIGVIILDEEGEASYKSESSPRYHAREVAKLRCVEHGALLLLASATPSVESRYKADRGVYHYFELKERYASARLPEVYLIDMRDEEQDANTSPLSRQLCGEIAENLKRGEQTILFINRRGYQTAMQCIDCGEAVKCPHCDAALTYHRDNDYMMCHYCGYSVRPPGECPSCHGHHLKRTGLGTQRLEEELLRRFPQARTLRMDADTTYSRYAYEEKFEAFRSGQYDILLGTQMIAKGLDFPNVTLVGVLNTDAGLYVPDYRGVERVFSLVTQVVGRSGRADKTGRAYIQTYLPDHPVLNFAARQDYDSFYRDELESRRILRYPPFCDLCTVSFSGTDPMQVAAAARRFAALMQEAATGCEGLSLQAFGPFRAAMYKMGGKYRERILVKCHFDRRFRAYLRRCLHRAGQDKSFRRITVSADINGELDA